MELATATVSRPRQVSPPSARSLELASQLRSAAIEGDETRITRLLSDLLRVRGLTKGQRVSLQLRALQNLVHTLRAAASNDEFTGLLNRRGFMQTATRLLDLAMRDRQPAYLIYFSVGRLSNEVQQRQMGNFMRDLFPGYGVYDVLGRLSCEEFAALTTDARHVSVTTIEQLARRSVGAGPVSPLRLRVGVAHFNPVRPIAIDELLTEAQQALERRPHAAPNCESGVDVARIASPGLAPQPGMTLC
jgi:GGDEF domain-containing protein